MKTPLFTWLHLSDIHFGHGDASHEWNQKLVLSKLLADLNNYAEFGIPKPDAVFVTGDIAFSGAVRARDEYDRAKDWLEKVADAVKLTCREIFLVPGNHDIQQDIYKSDRDVRRLVDRLRTGAEQLDEALAHSEDQEKLVRRIKNYLNFATNFGQLRPEPQRLYWVHRITLSLEMTLRVVGLNTALLSQDRDDKGQLALGNAQLVSALVDPSPLKDRELIVVLTHHPFEWLRDGSEVTQWIKRHGHIHLSGHVHNAESETSRSGSGTTFIKIVAGAAHNESLPPGIPEEHGYSFASIEYESDGALSLSVWPRRWSKNKDFRPDNDNVPGGKIYTLHSLGIRIPQLDQAGRLSETAQIDTSPSTVLDSPPHTPYTEELYRTELWKQLTNCCRTGQHTSYATKLLDFVSHLSSAMYERLIGHSSHATHLRALADPWHPLQMIRLMDRIIPEDVCSRLNAAEIALLILSAHFHDQGLLLTPAEFESLQAAPDFQIFRDNWVIEHPNLRELRQQLSNTRHADLEREQWRHKEAELSTGMLFNYLCFPTMWNHAERSAKVITSECQSGGRWQTQKRDLAAGVVDLCTTHLLPISQIKSLDRFHLDRSVGPFSVNMPFLAAVLRLADLMDLDLEQTPDSLYRSIHYTNDVTLEAWGKHRHVGTWQISPSVLRFSITCKHPAYQRAVLEFMDLIEISLSDTRELISSFPESFERYRIHLPLRIDRARIVPESDTYIYHNLEFTLSRDEIVHLLMTDKLYSSASLCVRELLQNSLDALRYRKALLRRDVSVDWNDGKVVFSHILDEYGRHILRCEDNGIGMDYEIITKFLTAVGRSYYRSPQFEQEQIGFRKAGVSFDPCAQFGIGFMSCFMLGDSIKIKTRRDYGPQKGIGEPLEVDINGLGGMLVVRKGQQNMLPGTVVEITSRHRPQILDQWSDPINLLEVLDGYALACEFPIEGYCQVPGITGSIFVEPTVEVRDLAIERSNVRNFVVLEQEFSEVHPDLDGVIRAAFLTDEVGAITIENSEAGWLRTGKDQQDISLLEKIDGVIKEGNPIISNREYRENQTCVDGILVCGEPGRHRQHMRLGSRGNLISLGRTSFILDVRGSLKPTLTPARTPPEHWGERDLTWQRLQLFADRALGRLWEQLTERLSDESQAEVFWQLSQIYRVPPIVMRAGTIWKSVWFPVLSPDGCRCEWRLLRDLERVFPRAVHEEEEKKRLKLETLAGLIIMPTELMTRWDKAGEPSEFYVRATALSMGRLGIENDQLFLDYSDPPSSDTNLIDCWVPSSPFRFNLLLIQHDKSASDLLTVRLPVSTANRDHPLVRVLVGSLFTKDRTDLQQFAHAAVHCLSDSTVIDELTSGSPVDRWRKFVGLLYEAVRWEDVPAEIHPPYRVWLDNGRVLEIGPEDFKSWASAILAKGA